MWVNLAVFYNEIFLNIRSHRLLLISSQKKSSRNRVHIMYRETKIVQALFDNFHLLNYLAILQRNNSMKKGASSGLDSRPVGQVIHIL